MRPDVHDLASIREEGLRRRRDLHQAAVLGDVDESTERRKIAQRPSRIMHALAGVLHLFRDGRSWPRS